MKTFPSASIYHSTLREAGAVVARFLSGPEPSQREGGGHYVKMQFGGDPATYYYTVENDAIKAQLDLMADEGDDFLKLGTWYVVLALGMRHTAQLQLGIPREEDIPQEPFVYHAIQRIAVDALVLAGTATECFRQKFDREPNEHEYGFAIACMIRQEKTGLPVWDEDVTADHTGTTPEVPDDMRVLGDPPEEGSGETLAKVDELDELLTLADENNLPQSKKEDLQRWIDEGTVTRIQYVEMRERILAHGASGKGQPEGSSD